MSEESESKPAGPDSPGVARDERASRAAHNSVDPNRLLPGEGADSDALLPGEDPTGTHRGDIEHWITVYSELLDFKRFMLDGAAARAGQMTTEVAKHEVEATDLRVARAEAERFTRRLSFWRGRLDSLLKVSPAP
ncbi:MAG: hypothetical protein NVS9B1_11590 [Candidatus Dormibacteraceae bacterium]